MNKKKQQEAKILEKILDLSQHAYDVAVSPGLLKMKKKDRLAALTALEKAGVAFPLEIMAVHTLSMVADQFNQAAQSPISLQTAHTIRDLFAVWKWGSTSEGDQLTYDDWSVACPTFPSLFAALSDQQKLALDLDTQEAEAEYEVRGNCESLPFLDVLSHFPMVLIWQPLVVYLCVSVYLWNGAGCQGIG